MSDRGMSPYGGGSSAPDMPPLMPTPAPADPARIQYRPLLGVEPMTYVIPFDRPGRTRTTPMIGPTGRPMPVLHRPAARSPSTATRG